MFGYPHFFSYPYFSGFFVNQIINQMPLTKDYIHIVGILFYFILFFLGCHCRVFFTSPESKAKYSMPFFLYLQFNPLSGKHTVNKFWHSFRPQTYPMTLPITIELGGSLEVNVNYTKVGQVCWSLTLSVYFKGYVQGLSNGIEILLVNYIRYLDT